jgi:hypothetical protein
VARPPTEDVQAHELHDLEVASRPEEDLGEHQVDQGTRRPGHRQDQGETDESDALGEVGDRHDPRAHAGADHERGRFPEAESTVAHGCLLPVPGRRPAMDQSVAISMYGIRPSGSGAVARSQASVNRSLRYVTWSHWRD